MEEGVRVVARMVVRVRVLVRVVVGCYWLGVGIDGI